MNTTSGGTDYTNLKQALNCKVPKGTYIKAIDCWKEPVTYQRRWHIICRIGPDDTPHRFTFDCSDEWFPFKQLLGKLLLLAP